MAVLVLIAHQSHDLAALSHGIVELRIDDTGLFQ